MIVSYGDQAMRTLALNGDAAVAQLGEPAATWLHALLAEIEAAGDASELLSLYGDALAISGTLISVAFAPGLIATFAAICDKGTISEQNAPAWATVRRLKLVKVESNELHR